MRLSRKMGLALAILTAATATPTRAAERYVVLPLANETGESSLYWMGEAMSLSITDYLLAAGEDAIDPERRREAQIEMGLDGGGPMTAASAILLGRRLGASMVIHGQVALRGEHSLALTGRLIPSTDAIADKTMGRPVTVQGAVSDMYRLQQEFVQVLLPQTRGRQESTPVPPLKELRQVPLSSFESYVKAITADEPERRRDLLDRALEADPVFAAALIARARVEIDRGTPSSAYIYLDRVPLDATAFPERYWLARGDAAAAAGDRGSAEDFFRRSLEARPSAKGRFRLAAVLAQQGRLLDARRELQAGLELDSQDPEGVELREALGESRTEPEP